MVDEDLIPDEMVVLGDDQDERRRFNDELRELVAAKMQAQYDLDVRPAALVVVEREGYVSVSVAGHDPAGEHDS